MGCENRGSGNGQPAGSWGRGRGIEEGIFRRITKFRRIDVLQVKSVGGRSGNSACDVRRGCLGAGGVCSRFEGEVWQVRW